MPRGRATGRHRRCLVCFYRNLYHVARRFRSTAFHFRSRGGSKNATWRKQKGAGVNYFEDPENRIQAGFALRAGRLLVQYDNACQRFPSEEQYDATLTICVLQALLTNCLELLNSMGQHHEQLKKLLDRTVTDIPFNMGLRKRFVLLDTFFDTLTYRQFITYIRNALSHPTWQDSQRLYKSTGYSTTHDRNNFINGIIFVSSPWIYRGKIGRSYRNTNRNRVEEELNKLTQKHGDVGLEVKQNCSGEFQIFVKNKLEPYFPIFEAHIPLKELKELIIDLSTYLSQPTRADWDGRSIERLVG